MSQTQLPELIQALLDPKSYPHSPPRVELVQTQMSFVFLAGDLVYKVKKPVNLGYLDYTTLEQRHFFCQKEVELNRRLCPGAYLGVVAITGQAGRISVDGTGHPLEYAVKMRHLPQETMLNNLLVRDKATPEMLAAVAEKLAEFHGKAETSAAISDFGSLDVIRQNTVENFEQTGKNIGTTISPEKYKRIKACTEDFLAQNTALFRRRTKEGKIRDCHGDLHAAHICFGDDGICIYDCIEFNDRFRYGDVASEVAFLAMDLDHYGRADLSRRFVSAYVAASGDTELEALLNFYKCYRAYVRGKVEGFKLADPHISPVEKTKTLAVAREYFDLADSYTMSEGGGELRKPFRQFIETGLGSGFVLIACGLPGTWKTETTEEVARVTGYPLLRTDLIRLELLQNEDVFDEKVAGNMDQRTMVYDEMLRRAEEILANKGEGVILDATFVTQSLRRRAAAIAAAHNLRFVILQTDCPQEASIRRILARTMENYESNALTEQAYLNNKKRFEAVDLDDLKSLYPDLDIVHLTVDTSQDSPEGWYVIGVAQK